MAGLLSGGRRALFLAAALALGCGGTPGGRPAIQATPKAFDKSHWERASTSFVEAYRQWVAKQGLESPAVRLERVLNMTDSGGYVVEAENAILTQLAIEDVPVLTGKPGEVAPEIVYELRVEATERVLRSGDLEARKTTIFFKLFEPNGRGIAVSEAHVEQFQEAAD
jgi:hypothetical protein